MLLITTLVSFFLCQLVTVAGETTPDNECLRLCEWPSQPKTCVYNFTVEWFYSMSVACKDCPLNKTHCHQQYCIPLNGVARPVVLVNKILPGPAIQVCENDTIIVNVTNYLDNSEGTSIHWHGVHQRETPYMDGVAMVTQCPIDSRTSFQYTFNATPYGTHWWHAHSGLQRSDGAFGAMIIRQASQADYNSDHYDFDLPEHVVSVHDWFDNMALAVYTSHKYGGGSFFPNSILINGKGRRREFQNNHGETVYTDREMFTVTYGMRYRFRIFSNAIAVCPLQISVDAHKLTVIASDGASLQPYEADSFIINSGERYDFVLDANQEITNYWMRVKGFVDCRGLEEFALVKYEGAVDDEPPEGESQPEDHSKKIVVNPLDINDSEIRAVPIVELDSAAESDDARLMGAADVVFYLGMDFNGVNRYFDYPSTDDSGGSGRPMENPTTARPTGQMPDGLTTTTPHNKDSSMGQTTASQTNLSSEQGDDGHASMTSSPPSGGGQGGDGPGGNRDDQVDLRIQYLFTAQINHMSFKINSKPPLTQSSEIPKEEFCTIMANQPRSYPAHCEQTYCNCAQTINVALGHVVELVLVDEGQLFNMAHPMHLHGYSFRVVAQGKLGTSTTLEDVIRLDKAGNITRKLENSPLKDTVIVQDGGYTIVRFIADNPGWWFFHCHLEFHLEAGMALLVHVGSDNDLSPKPNNFPRCGSWPYEDAESEQTIRKYRKIRN